MDERVKSKNGDKARPTAIRRARLQLDVTQAQMAERMGISRTTYNQLERGKGISARLARKIADQTGQTVGEVWDEYEPRESR
jgi:DNA-binding XRE family transcriptional regulator